MPNVSLSWVREALGGEPSAIRVDSDETGQCRIGRYSEFFGAHNFVEIYKYVHVNNIHSIVGSLKSIIIK